LELTVFFLFDNTKLEVCEDISYLGITFNYNGSFIKAKNKLVQQAQKASYSVYRKVRNLCIPVDLQLKLFDSIVLPILTYSCEVWGFENCAEIEQVHLRFCKKILKVRQTTSNYMVKTIVIYVIYIYTVNGHTYSPHPRFYAIYFI